MQVFNFDAAIKSKSWEVTQVLDGTHCRQKSNILEMATLTNCIDLFSETEQKQGNYPFVVCETTYECGLVRR